MYGISHCIFRYTIHKYRDSPEKSIFMLRWLNSSFLCSLTLLYKMGGYSINTPSHWGGLELLYFPSPAFYVWLWYEHIIHVMRDRIKMLRADSLCSPTSDFVIADGESGIRFNTYISSFCILKFIAKQCFIRFSLAPAVLFSVIISLISQAASHSHKATHSYQNNYYCYHVAPWFLFFNQV